MKHDKTLLIIALLFFAAGFALYLIQKEFSILIFGLLIAGISCGRYSNRIGRLRVLGSEADDPEIRHRIAGDWYNGTERKTDRLATRYITPLIFIGGFLLALLRDRLDIGLFSGLILIMYIIDRVIINRMDERSKALLDAKSNDRGEWAVD